MAKPSTDTTAAETASTTTEVSEANVETPVAKADFEPVEMVNFRGEKRTATTVGEKVALEFSGFTSDLDRFKKTASK